MIEFRNGRFHAKGVSFAIPEGFFINTTAHFSYEYGLEFCHPELKYSITIHLDETKLNAYREIELGFEDYNIKSCEKNILPITVNGLDGYQCLRKDVFGSEYEVRLNIHENLQLSFLMRSRGNLEQFINSSEVQWTLSQIGID